MQDRETQVHDVYYLVKEDLIVKGISVRQASEELTVSERTIFRMIEDGRLKAKKIYFTEDRYVWEIDPVSVAKLELRKEASDKKQYRKVKEEKNE